jgi:NACalpha-BTF3-like transcription factor
VSPPSPNTSIWTKCYIIQLFPQTYTQLDIAIWYCSAPELVSSDDKKDDKPASSNVEPDEKDIKLVMEQASVEREKAVKAIKEADGDLINASESEF